jgi:hypothetical protein
VTFFYICCGIAITLGVTDFLKKLDRDGSASDAAANHAAGLIDKLFKPK